MPILARPRHVRYFTKMRKGRFPKGLDFVQLDDVPIEVAPAQFDTVYLVGHVLKHLVMDTIGMSRPIYRAKEGHIELLFDEAIQLQCFELKEKAIKKDPIKRGLW